MNNRDIPLIDGELYFIILKDTKDPKFITVGLYDSFGIGIFMIIGTKEEFPADMYDVISHIKKPEL